ncbi:MAG: ankyrin repeat domain-containing protein [Cyanobacteria bacterium P01_A01_bin.123]
MPPEDLGYEKMYQATINGDIKALRQILKKYQCANNKDGLGRTPLFYAVQKSQDEAALLLIEMGSEINFQDTQGKTPLHVAALYGQEKMVQLLIERGANLEIKDLMYLTPLGVSVAEGYESIARLLINSGADVNVRLGSSESSDTLLHMAVSAMNKKRNIKIVELLLSSDADVHAKSGMFGYTPLYYLEDYANFGLSWLPSYWRKDEEIEELLKRYGASSKMYDWAKPMHIVRDILRTCSS